VLVIDPRPGNTTSNCAADNRDNYDTLRARATGHHAALHQLGNRLVGVLHGCLKTGTPYDDDTARGHHHEKDQHDAA
jgi:hypothetical protein